MDIVVYTLFLVIYFYIWYVSLNRSLGDGKEMQVPILSIFFSFLIIITILSIVLHFLCSFQNFMMGQFESEPIIMFDKFIVNILFPFFIAFVLSEVVYYYYSIFLMSGKDGREDNIRVLYIANLFIVLLTFVFIHSLFGKSEQKPT